MTTTTPIIRSEDSAEQRTVTGWACKHCGRFWGSEERMARYCCATDFPCECGGRRPKHYIRCDDCQRRQEAAKWAAKPEIKWNGEFPIGLWDSDRYFFDADELFGYLDEFDGEESIDDLRLTSCQETIGREFEMSEHLQDCLAEDQELDDEEINRVVNAWIAEHKPKTYEMTGERLSIASVKKALGMEDVAP